MDLSAPYWSLVSGQRGGLQKRCWPLCWPVLMARLFPSFRGFHLVPRCILLEACLWHAHTFISIEQTHFFLSLFQDVPGIPGTVHRKIEMFLVGAIFLLRKLWTLWVRRTAVRDTRWLILGLEWDKLAALRGGRHSNIILFLLLPKCFRV